MQLEVAVAATLSDVELNIGMELNTAPAIFRWFGFDLEERGNLRVAEIGQALFDLIEWEVG